MKRVIDLVGALLLSIVAAPVLALTAVAVFLRLGTPVIIRQPRVGLDGSVFLMHKFRSMQPDRRGNAISKWNSAERRVSHKRPDDPRLVPLGRFIRKWSLDELPQLYNVLRGEMSLVGPRPEMVSIVAQYQPWQHARHQVKPGLTGWWQVSARNKGLMHEHTDEDLRYLERVSLLTDLKLILLTLPAVLLKMRGQ